MSRPAPPSCISCNAGDTRTGVAIRGEAEFIVAALRSLTGMSTDEAAATMQVAWKEQYGSKRGEVPDGKITQLVCICERCAGRRGVEVGPVDGEVPLYSQEIYDHGMREREEKRARAQAAIQERRAETRRQRQERLRREEAEAREAARAAAEHRVRKTIEKHPPAPKCDKCKRRVAEPHSLYCTSCQAWIERRSRS
jgi:hypothetical protein